MTDKEEIIIDGVNVSGCAYFDYENEGTKECYAYSNECEANNCYFKQLARKTQECEELKEEKAEIKKFLGISSKTILERLEELQERRDELSDKNLSYEQALDEIEKELKEDINCESQECGCDDFEECLKCTKEHILDIINKAKDGKNEQL